MKIKYVVYMQLTKPIFNLLTLTKIFCTLHNLTATTSFLLSGYIDYNCCIYVLS